MNDKNRIRIIAENITYYRKQKGVTQKELAKQVGVTPSTMSDYMNYRSAPSFGVIQKLADYFEVKKSDIDTTFREEEQSSPTAQIIELDRELHEPRHSEWISHGEELLAEQTAEQNTAEDSKDIVDNIIQFPKLFSYDYYDQPASAGTGQYLNDVQIEQIELPVEYDADFVIPIYGDSMEPEYHSGDYVFVKLSIDLSDGDIGVFEYYGDAYIKQLIINDSGAFLHSLNQCGDYPDILIDADSDFRIIGEVLGKYSEN